MKNVMIIDDDPAIVEVVKLILEMYDYKVCSSTNGFSLLKSHDVLPDLLLLDIWMPGIDGKILCKKLKSMEDTKRMPILIISASKNLKKEAQEAKADGFLEKPFEMEDLLLIVEKYAGSS